MKRGGPLRRTRGLARSAKRIRPVARRKDSEHRAALRWRKQYLAEHRLCEIHLSMSTTPFGGLDREDIHVLLKWVTRRPCSWLSVDVHEVVKRGRGGAVDEQENVLACCRNCHDFTEAHPRISSLLGLLASNAKWRKGDTRLP